VKTKAVFLDRDGTINTEVGYLNHPDQLELIPRSALAIKLLNEAGFKTVVITNQAGIAKGLLQETLLPEIHQRLSMLLDKEGARIEHAAMGDGIVGISGHENHFESRSHWDNPAIQLLDV